jgi:hypothetical protein
VDATLLWTVVGSVAGVAAVAIALGAWWTQARSERKHPPLTANDRLRVVVESDAGADDDSAQVRRVEDQAAGQDITQAGWLRFASISLADTMYWSEMPVDSDRRRQVFDRKPTQYFCIDFNKAFVYDPELIFDLTIVNRSASQPLVLREIGVRWTALCRILYAYGIPKAAKIGRDGKYMIVCDPEKFKLAMPIPQPDLWSEDIGPIDSAIDENVVLPDPIYLEPQAPFRFSLELKNYTKAVPNHALIRFWLRSEPGIDWSPEVEIFTI